MVLSFTMLPLKPNGEIKNTGAYNQIPSDLAIFRHKAPSGVCRWSLSEHDTLVRLKGTARHLHHGARWNPRTVSFILAEQAAPVLSLAD
jgi:hypothetical protein